MARPRVHLNCAISLDGKMAAPDGTPVQLSDEKDLRRVHGLRAGCDAILVGVGTVLADDPALRVKPDYAAGPDPLRVVLDPRGRVPASARVLDGSTPSLVVRAEGRTGPTGHAAQIELRAGPDGLDLDALLEALAGRGVTSLLVEGGPRVLGSFLRAPIWDHCTIYQAPQSIGGDGPCLLGVPANAWKLESVQPFGEGVLWSFLPGPG